MKVMTGNVVKALRPNLTLVESQKNNYVSMSDNQLVKACQMHDQSALRELLLRHERTIRAILARLAPDWQDTSDLVQEARIRIWRSVGNLRNPNSFKTWLRQIVTNLFYDELRKRPRQIQLLSLDEPVQSEDGSEGKRRDIVDTRQQPDDRLLANELAQVLEDAMAKVPSQFRTAAYLRDVIGLSYEQIAETTGSELGTVKSRISRARLRIQREVEPYLRECA
jgi:RNA polymerase sigma-70 factor (ECF subfamily)